MEMKATCILLISYLKGVIVQPELHSGDVTQPCRKASATAEKDN
jgi:hypothetical protein